MTRRCGNCASVLMTPSVIPSARYSSDGSLPELVKGSTRSEFAAVRAARSRGAMSRYPLFGMVWITCGSLGLSPNTFRNSEMARVSTSSVTKVLGHTAESSCSLVTTSCGCCARRSSTCITLGSTREARPSPEMLLSFGSTVQRPMRKSPSMGMMGSGVNLPVCSIISFA